MVEINNINVNPPSNVSNTPVSSGPITRPKKLQMYMRPVVNTLDSFSSLRIR